MSSLIHLIYASSATAALDTSRLGELLAISRRNNATAGMTGVLLYIDGSFFQVLEGEAAVVDTAYARIERDPRHADAVVVIREPIAQRAFGRWSMGYVTAGPTELQELTGANDFFAGAASFRALSPGRAKKLLEAFAKGRWRSRLDATIPLPSNPVAAVAPTPTPVSAAA